VALKFIVRGAFHKQVRIFDAALLKETYTAL